MLTMTAKCGCGALIAVPVFAYPLIPSFQQSHLHCITQTSNDDIEEPGGDVYASAERSAPHSEPELTTGFQRVVW